MGKMKSKQNRRLLDLAPFLIAIIFFAGYFTLATIIIAALWTKSVTGEALQPIIQMLKDQGLAIMVILTFYFGSAYRQRD